MLSERKKKILQAVISENIKKAEPISSKELQERFFTDVSSATIRNDLSSLEDMGYLFQPHTSAGRLPTALGFKKYIDELMEDKKLSKSELELLKQGLNKKVSGIEDLAQVVAKTISDATSYASVVQMGITSDAEVESVKIVKITDDTCLIILVTDLGVIKDLMITLPWAVSDDDTAAAGRILSDLLCGIKITNIESVRPQLLVRQEIEKYRVMFDLVLEAIATRGEKPVVKMDGASNLLLQPEYDSLDKARKAMKLFESKELLLPLASTGNDLEISIKVGASENEDCSIVTANYKINGKNIGRAGVVGPVRMDYAKAISVLKGVNDTISNGLQGLLVGQSNTKNKKSGGKNGRNNKYRSRKSRTKEKDF